MRRELDVLVRLGLIEPMEKSPGEIRQFFIANQDHPAWAAIDGAVSAVNDLAATAET